MNIQILAEERHRLIRALLATEGRVLAADLASRLGVSDDTVRRDLRELASAGECRRVYGGAVPLAPSAAPRQVRATMSVAAKARLAAEAVKLIMPGQLVFIDTGTTNLGIARAIPPTLDVTVATNSVQVAAALSEYPRVSLIVLGGAYDNESGGCTGAETLAAIGRLFADIAFLGACGVHAAVGLTAFHGGEAEVKRAMARSAAKVAVASTGDKLGIAAPFRVAAPAEVAHLFVEADAPDEVPQALAALGTVIHRA